MLGTGGGAEGVVDCGGGVCDGGHEDDVGFLVVVFALFSCSLRDIAMAS